MKIIKTASGKKTLKISKSEWQTIGTKAGWVKKAQTNEESMVEYLFGIVVECRKLTAEFNQRTLVPDKYFERLREMKDGVQSAIDIAKGYGVQAITDMAGALMGTLNVAVNNSKGIEWLWLANLEKKVSALPSQI